MPTGSPAAAVPPADPSIAPPDWKAIPSFADEPFLPRTPSFMSPWVDSLQSYVESLHDALGAPWWATIVLTALSVRAVTFPITLFHMRRMATIGRLSGGHYQAVGKLSAYYGLDKSPKEQAIFALRARSRLWKAYGCQFWKLLIPMAVQTSFFISFAMATRQLIPAHPEFATESLLWLSNLATPDPYMALPIINTLIAYSMFELGSRQPGPPLLSRLRALLSGRPQPQLNAPALTQAQVQAKEEQNTPWRQMMGKLAHILQLSTILIWPMTSALPAAVPLYMFSLLVWNLCQSLLLRRSRLVQQRIFKLERAPLPVTEADLNLLRACVPPARLEAKAAEINARTRGKSPPAAAAAATRPSLSAKGPRY